MQPLVDAGDTGGENTGLLSSGMIVVAEDQSNIYDKFSPKKLKKKNGMGIQGTQGMPQLGGSTQNYKPNTKSAYQNDEQNAYTMNMQYHPLSNAQAAQGLRLNSKSPGRGNLAPMNYQKVSQLSNHQPSNENYNYSIPSDTFYPMMNTNTNNFNSAQSNNINGMSHNY